MFNFRTWKTYTFWIVIALTFYAGAVVDAAGKQATTAQPSVQTRTITVPDTADLAKLDALDRQIFGVSAQVISLQSDGLQLAGQGIVGLANGTLSVADMQSMTTQLQAKAGQISALNDQVTTLTAQRQHLLATAGVK